MIPCSSQEKAIPFVHYVVIGRILVRRQTITKDNRLQLNPEQVKDLVLQSLDDNKGIDIVSIPLDGKSLIADFMVIASGASSRQVAALAEHLEVKLKRAGVPILGKEGLAQADWVLLDTAEVIVHLFRPEVRDFYSLERMWDIATPRDEIVHVHAD